MKTENPFSIVRRDVEAISDFLIYDGVDTYNPNTDLTKVAVRGIFEALTPGNKKHRRKYQSQVFDKDKVTPELLEAFKKEWTENYRTYMKEKVNK